MRPLFILITAAILLASFEYPKPGKPKLPAEFSLIPSGSYSIADNGNEKIFSIKAFYISKYEVTNQQYRQFLAEISNAVNAAELEKISCDSLGWQQVMSYSRPLVEYYYRHPSYNEYPVVNISYEGAIKYCSWLQEKIQLNNPNFDVQVRLPGKHEWTYAAMGGRSQAVYPWTNWYLRNNKGEYLCNFKRVGDQAIIRNRETGLPVIKDSGMSTAEFLTANVKSYYPNDYGLYNMSGNAAEMISEKGICMGGSWNDYGGDVTTRSESNYKNIAPTVGFRPVVVVKEKKSPK